MNKRSLVFIIFSIPGILFSGEFKFDESDLSEVFNSHYLVLSRIHIETAWFSGCSLLEAFPLMEDVYRMEIIQNNDSLVLIEDDLAEYWGESYLIKDGIDIALLFKGSLYRNITEIKFHGTPLESDELEIWLNWEGIDELKGEINRFAERHNLSIHSLEVPRPESKLISVVRARGDIPDLVMLQSSAVENLVRSRAIQNLDYLKMPDLIELGEKAFTLGGKLWAIPFYFDTQVLFYNKNLIPRLPSERWTLEEMERLARQIKIKNIHPLVWNAYSSNWLIPFQIGFGKDKLIETDGRIIITDSSTEKALEYIVRLKSEGLLIPMERDAMNALFISGRVGMIMSGSYSIPYFESLGLDFGVLPYPVNQETGKNLSPLLDFKAFCMTRQTRSPILARRMLQYLSGAGVQQRFCPALFKLSARRDVLDIPVRSSGHLDVLKETIDEGTIIPPENIYSIYKNNMWKLLRFTLSGRMSVKQTLEQGQTLMENANTY